MNVANSLSNQLHHMVALLSRESDQILQEQFGIGLSQYKILTAIQMHSEVQQKVIARQLGQTEASISRQIALLQQQNMILSVKNPNDQRQHLAGLTMKGIRVIAAADKVLASYHETFFSSLSEKQQQTLFELTKRIKH